MEAIKYREGLQRIIESRGSEIKILQVKEPADKWEEVTEIKYKEKRIRGIIRYYITEREKEGIGIKEPVDIIITTFWDGIKGIRADNDLIEHKGKRYRVVKIVKEGEMRGIISRGTIYGRKTE